MLKVTFISILFVLLFSLSKGSINDCGCAPVVPDKNRIIGGVNVRRNSLPYQVLIQCDTNMDDAIRVCGGSILNKRYILTAAHCLAHYSDPFPAKQFRVFAGILDKCKEARFQDGLKVNKVIIRPDYPGPHISHDVGLLRLKKPLTFSDAIRPICLPEDTKNLYAYRTGVVSGWGDQAYNKHGQPKPPSKLPCILQRAKLTIWKSIDDKRCKVEYGRMCAYAHRAGACVGDSGSPLAVKEKEGYVVVGIVSTGKGCGDVTPGVYARVTKYKDWIRENIKDGDCSKN